MIDRRCSIQRRHQQQQMDVYAESLKEFLIHVLAEWALHSAAAAIQTATTASERERGDVRADYTLQITLEARFDD